MRRAFHLQHNDGMQYEIYNNEPNSAIRMHCTIADYDRKNGIAGYV